VFSREFRATPRAGVALAPLTTLGVGGPARWLMRATTVEQVAAAHAWADERDLPLFVLGGGSNVVVADCGFEGLVLQVAITGIEARADDGDTLITAGAGEPWDRVVAASVARGLAGLECLSGIPGSVGGTPVQNVGAYGQEVAGTIEAVVAYDRTTRRVLQLRPEECAFAYRMSRFKGADADRFVITSVTFRLRPDKPTVTYPDVVSYVREHQLVAPGVADVRAAVLAIRRQKGMVLDPSDSDTRGVGSFFMNPVVSADICERVSTLAGVPAPRCVLPDGRVKIPAAWLIERAGFRKGQSAGPVGISSKHPLALVNRGGATARDVLRLAAAIKSRVVDRFGIWLRPEPIFVGFGADADVVYLLETGE
jgi:UDP-N-acetylmuramate dehydrogenase